MTQASQIALAGLWDWTMIKWYIIPLLAIVFYIYVREIKEARYSGNWDAIFAGLTLFGVDFFNETWNGWVLALTGRSACWTTPGDTALRTMVGWNIEIMFMFAIAGLIYYHTLDDDPRKKILGLPNRWFWAIGYAVFCVFVEVLLNLGGHLVWEYPFWNRSLAGLVPVFIFGYFYFYVAIILVLKLKTRARKITAISLIYAVPILMNIFGKAVMHWRY